MYFINVELPFQMAIQNFDVILLRAKFSKKIMFALDPQIETIIKKSRQSEFSFLFLLMLYQTGKLCFEKLTKT